MKLKSNGAVRKANKSLARVRIKPFQNMGLPKALVKEIREEFENCFAQGVLFERRNTNWQAQP
jgi:hypothetical protein